MRACFAIPLVWYHKTKVNTIMSLVLLKITIRIHLTLSARDFRIPLIQFQKQSTRCWSYYWKSSFGSMLSSMHIYFTYPCYRFTLFYLYFDTEAHSNTLQHTATHCNTLQHTATDPHKLPLLSCSIGNVLQCVAVCCSTLQRDYCPFL